MACLSKIFEISLQVCPSNKNTIGRFKNLIHCTVVIAYSEVMEQHFMNKSKLPFYAQFELTYSCPMKCPHCYNDEGYDCGGLERKVISKEDINPETVRKVVQKLGRDAGIFYITFTGGEPLMFQDGLFAGLETAKEEGIKCDINSTVSLMTEDIAKKLNELGIQSVLTSLASHIPEVHNRKMGREDSNPFEKTVRGIRLLQKFAPNVSISSNMVLANDNYEHVYQLGMFLSYLGVDAMTVTPSTPSRTGVNAQIQTVPSDQMMLEALYSLRRVEDDFGLRTRLLQGTAQCFLHPHVLLRQYMEAGCDAGRTYITVDPFGNIKPCTQISDGYGNILTEDFESIWNKMQVYRDNEFVPELCAPCDLKEVCGGGCRAEAERRVGSLKSKHPFFRKPLKLLQQEVPITLAGEIGKNYVLNSDCTWRQEDSRTYTIRSFNNHYITLSEEGMSFLRVVQHKGSFTLTQKMVENKEFVKFFNLSLENKILEVA